MGLREVHCQDHRRMELAQGHVQWGVSFLTILKLEFWYQKVNYSVNYIYIVYYEE
jgi:hypothetical protein